MTKPPATLESFKRHAKKLKRNFQITHTDALDAFARSCGFENYRHALKFYEPQEHSNAR